MIIEFRVTNFRSFKETQVFSMVAGNFPEHTESNIYDPKLKGFEERLLRSSAIYGANAAGKTNILRAIQFMQSVVLTSATSTTGIPYSPFKFSSSTRNTPSEFEITFIQNGTRYEYGFAVSAERVEREWLIEFANSRGRTLYEREYNKKKGEYTWKYSPFLKGQRALWSKSTRPNALFLSTALQLNSVQLIPVFEWFQKRLVVLVGETKFNAFLTLSLLEESGGKERLLSFMQEADFGISDFDIKREPVPAGSMFIMGNPIIELKPGSATPNHVIVTMSHKSDNSEHSVLELSEESNGTQTFFKSAGAWINVLKNGEVLLIDEVEATFHPQLVRFLIRKFHSEKNNPQNAQLIFTTHNTDLLDQELLRRDQVWFVDKNRDNCSKIYPLTDFKPRNDEVLERWYKRGRYGALPVLNQL